MKHMVALVGHQQIPNLLPAFFFRPQEILLVHSEFTEPEYQRLETLLLQNQICVMGLKCQDEYETLSMAHELRARLATLGFQDDIVFNVTGGTKAMVLSAYECARRVGGKVIYLESGRGTAHLYQYGFTDNGELELDEQYDIPPLLTIEQFLDAHLGKDSWRESGYSKDIGGLFEEAVGEALRDIVDELKPGVRFLGNEYGKREQADLDLVIRVNNQFGVIEVKDQKKATLDALKQLHYLSQLLGTYTKKFWVLSQETNPDHEAVIQATRTREIELPRFVGGVMDDRDRQRLRSLIMEAFARQGSRQSSALPVGEGSL